MSILTYILSCLYFFLPAYFVNMTPPLARRANLFNFLDRDVDFGRKFLGQPILGSHKSWRGVILGILVGFLVVLFQNFLYRFPAIQRISFLDYGRLNIFLFGFLISAGAVFGDLLFAFIKRRLKMKPGTRFIPFDQTNYVIGSAIFLTAFFKAEIMVGQLQKNSAVLPDVVQNQIFGWITLFILTFLLHIIFNRIGYYLRINRAKW